MPVAHWIEIRYKGIVYGARVIRTSPSPPPPLIIVTDAGYCSETLALPPPEPRPLELPYTARGGASSCNGLYDELPLQLQLKWEELLPTQLLTPRDAERDERTRDTYNFVTIEVRDCVRCYGHKDVLLLYMAVLARTDIFLI